ncbi:MAG TPA: ThuA domain-containing protein [Cyclobacteriaceae bacterium]|nr:ThuA domain-containing protein [Cyclobacteriaceae bacterium]
MNRDRRLFLSRAAALTTAAALPFLSSASAFARATPVAPALPSLKGRKVLFTYGGWDGHEPKKFLDYMTPWLQEEGAEVQSFPTLEPYTDKALMATIDLVIQVFTMSQITKEQEAGLLEAVKVNGTGMAGWHGGMGDSFRNNVEYQYMVGGQWVAHPGNVIDYDVHIIDQKDDVTKGLKDFHMKSEQYYMHIDPNVKVLATTKFNGAVNSWIDGAVLPVAWKKSYGKGRIFYTSVGHNLAHVTEVPDAIELIKRGVKWASASKYEPAEKWMNPMYKF